VNVLTRAQVELGMKKKDQAPTLTIRPLTPELWPSLEDLFGRNGAYGGCWCMYPRIGSAYTKWPGDENRRDFCEVVRRGPPPGLLAFDGDLAVGWCQITPRAAVPWLDRTWRLSRVDDVPVWSISCLYVRKGHRRKGITAALVAAAVKIAARARAPAVEAYPVDPAVSPSASGTGFVSTFSRAGFRIVARRTPARPIMRRTLTSAGSS
jgi:GNAT superfamily N-acetyltransferase